MKWDVFISHATEDKDSFVLPLTRILTEMGVKVWLDKFELKVGDDLFKSIKFGLEKSKFGIVILSKAFFEKKWTDRELACLYDKEYDNNKKVILPIWYKIDKDLVSKYDRFLATKYSLVSDELHIYETALELLKVINSKRYNNINRLKIYDKLSELSSTVYDFDIMKHKESIEKNTPIRHKNLPVELLLMIKIIQLVFRDAYDISYEETVEHFKRDTNPEREILIWLRMSAVYLTIFNERNLDIEDTNRVFLELLQVSAGSKFDTRWAGYMNEQEFNYIKELYDNIVPGIKNLKSDMRFNYPEIRS